MGRFVILSGACPVCGDTVNIETKIVYGTTEKIMEGDTITPYPALTALFMIEKDNKVIIELQPCCPKCGSILNAHFSNAKFVGFTEKNAKYKEFDWGDLRKANG